YTAIIDSKKIGMHVMAYILVSFSRESDVSQKDLARKIASFPQVCEVSIITGEWDILVKVKEESVEAIGNFVVDKLRNLIGIEKTLTLVVLHNEKESLEVFIK
ncbi:MAG: Lrp/AsnC family transcriptional regulator, partial [Candidatus Aenigmarchaeota archaeon]|nr:Lrp/AsnC family transcriptional regulator [Candidatus Aenigmarchaeota archaeon]MDW8149196.1 Lrp/AsnC family transcriptional regulator [Candidatus Aenigmarchaeota archaeon]